MFIDALEAGAMPPEQSAIGAGPDLALAVFEHRADELVGQSVFRSEVVEAAILKLHEAAAVGSDPERAVARHRKRANVVIGDPGAVEARVDHEADAVETGQAARS